MKIGEKEFTPKYTNRRIYELEEAFDNKPYSQFIVEAANFSMKQLGILIWHGIKDEMTFEEFTDMIEPYQYEVASVECGKALLSAFTVKKK